MVPDVRFVTSLRDSDTGNLSVIPGRNELFRGKKNTSVILS